MTYYFSKSTNTRCEQQNHILLSFNKCKISRIEVSIQSSNGRFSLLLRTPSQTEALLNVHQPIILKFVFNKYKSLFKITENFVSNNFDWVPWRKSVSLD